MSLTVDLVLDLNDRGALYHCASSIKKYIQGVDVRLIDYRESIESAADITHFFTWYIHRDSNITADDSKSLVSLHHISKHYSHVQYLISRNIPIVSMSTEWQLLLRRMGAKKEYNALVPHGVDLEFWSPETKKSASSGFTIGIIGRVYQDGRKGEWLIPQIFQHLKGCGARVVFVGPGWENVAAQLRTMDIDTTQFVDLDVECLRSQMHSFSVLLSTSDVEGGPLPLLEAMAVGVTPVSTPVGIARDLLPGRNVGYIFPKGSAYLAAMLLRKLKNGDLPLIDTYELRRSAGLASWANTAQGYYQVYRAIATGKVLPSDPCNFSSVMNDRRLSFLEWLSLKSNPYPTDAWTQPLFWRGVNKLRKIS